MRIPFWQLVIASTLLLTGNPRIEAADRPNVLLVYSDDQGSVDANCYGAADLETPHMDHLAETGIRFTAMYSPSAICSASRAGLLTGRFPARAGVPSNVSSQKGQPGMPTEQETIAEMLRKVGYATGHVGKWHLGFTPETMPNGQGFDASFGHMGGCIDNYSHFFYWSGPNRHDLWRNGKEIWQDGRYFGDAMVEECQKFIDANRQTPFFLYWAINWPHYPLQGTTKWRERYKDLPHPRDKYAAFVSTLDEQLGRVLAHLEQRGLRDNTIVIYQSDHGHSMEERTFSGGGSAGKFRGAKGCLFEGGIRVPSIVSWPKGIPQGETRSQMATGCDWFPTLAELCGVETVAGKLDGRSLTSVLKNAAAPSPHQGRFYWRLGRGPNAQWVVRDGDWKLLGNPRDTSNTAPLTKEDRLFLVNLRDDIQERRNLASVQAEVVERLLGMRRDYEADIEATD